MNKKTSATDRFWKTSVELLQVAWKYSYITTRVSEVSRGILSSVGFCTLVGIGRQVAYLFLCDCVGPDTMGSNFHSGVECSISELSKVSANIFERVGYLVLNIIKECSVAVVNARRKEEAICRRGPHKLWLKRATIDDESFFQRITIYCNPLKWLVVLSYFSVFFTTLSFCSSVNAVIIVGFINISLFLYSRIRAPEMAAI
ncbi:protein artichoke [Vespula maculifrons]|uniref:Protein artichoke n=1 Tax=Vespula maculifrons TaxID=7453 RepID=A0ABD2CA36_VESMC